MERILEDVENMRLLKIAESRDNSHTSAFEDLVAEEGFSMEEIKKLAEKVELE